MNRTSLLLRRALGLGCASVLVFAACGGSDEPGAETPATTEANADEASGDETAGDDTASEPEPVDTELAPLVTEAAPVETEPPPLVTEPAPLGLPDCLIGDWIVTAEELNAYYGAIGDNLGAEVSMTTTGMATMSFTATEYVYAGDFALEMTIVGQTAVGEATGSARGTWTLVDDVIQGELAVSDVDVVVTLDGATLDQTGLANTLIQANPVHNAPVSCDGPTISFESAANGADRHPIRLTPA